MVRASTTVIAPAAVSRRRGDHERRHDLDGLRALAVLLVAVYHVWIHRVSGGVDVFLVLSGFFVGGGVVRACTAGRLRIGPYLARIAGRLLPALVLVVGVVMLAAILLFPVTMWSETASQAIASILHVENWYLASASRDYGAADAASSPYQHIWSLAVQGQIFVALPLVLWAAAAILRRTTGRPVGRSLVVVVAALALASFGYACVGVVLDQPWAYFDTFARSWEYLAGTLAAIGLSAWSTRERAAESAGGAAAALAGWVGLAAILATGVVVDGMTMFPGPATLLPVGGALLLIAFAGSRWAPSRVLGWSPIARAGTYAYAFYLWHWPVLVFALAVRDGREVGWLAGSAVILASAALAVITTEGIDRARAAFAVRGSWSPRSGALAATAVALVLALPASWLVRVELERESFSAGRSDLTEHPGAMAAAYPELFDAEAPVTIIPSLTVASEDKPLTVVDNCTSSRTEVVVCSYGDLEADRVIAVVGGSHTEQWLDALDLIGQQSGFRVDAMIKWTCELIDGLEGVEFFAELNPDCEQWSSNAIAHLVDDPPDAVLTTLTRPSEGIAEPHEVVPPSYERAWLQLAEAGIPTIGIRDNPWTGTDTLECVASHPDDLSVCGVPAADFLDEEPPFPQLLGDQASMVRLLDMNDVICPDGWCPFVQGGRIVYRDQHHLTNSYVLSTTPILEERLLPLLGW